MSNEDTIQSILDGHTDDIKEIFSKIRKFINDPGLDMKEEPKKGWKNITYKRNKTICYIQPHSKHVNLGFYNGANLEDKKIFSWVLENP